MTTPKNMVRVSVTEAHGAAAGALESAGLTHDDARCVADNLLDAELTGRTGHGLVRLPDLLKHAATCGSDCISITRDSGSLISLDGGGALGYLVGARAVSIALERLADHPMVAVGCRGSKHTGAIGYYVRQLALAGHAALAMTHCVPLLAPHGARRAVFGTNPIAFACPGPDHPFVVDVSPAKTTFGAVLAAQERGESLEPGSALDADGEPTTDPARARKGALLPMGGPKGSALAFMVQLIAGALCGAAGVPQPGRDYGFFLLGMRIDAFVDDKQVAGAINEITEAIHDADAQCAGEGSEARRKSHSENGFDVPRNLWVGIRE